MIKIKTVIIEVLVLSIVLKDVDALAEDDVVKVTAIVENIIEVAVDLGDVVKEDDTTPTITKVVEDVEMEMEIEMKMKVIFHHKC